MSVPDDQLIDIAAERLERAAIDRIIEGDSLPGWERPRDWFEETLRRGCTDEAPL